MGFFVWRVRLEADSFEAREEARKPITEQDVGKTYKRQKHECLVLTRDPLGLDVPHQALAMRIGENPERWRDWNATVEFMECLGWAQHKEDADA